MILRPPLAIPLRTTILNFDKTRIKPLNLDFRIHWNRIWTLSFLINLVGAFIMINAVDLSAQVTQPAIYEREHKGRDHEFIIISMGEHGLALVRDTEKFEGSKKTWEVIIADTTLHEAWVPIVDIDQRMNIVGHDYRDGNLYLIFEEPGTNSHQIILVEVLLAEKTIKQHQFKPQVTLQLTHFSVLKNKAIFGGYITKEPALIMYDMTNESAKIIPGVFRNKAELIDVRTNSNDTFNALLIERDTKSKKLVVRTYDTNGVMLVDDIITIDDDKSVLEGLTSMLVLDELVVMGTWAYHTNKLASGFFSVIVDPFNDQKINYYDLAELNHFLDYLKPKKAAKIKAKAEWRKKMGKTPEFRAYLNVIKVDENKKGFTLLTEVYEPSNSYSNSRYSPYGNSSYNYYNSPYGYSPYGVSAMPYRYYNSPYGYTNPYGPNSYSTTNYTRITHSSLLSFDSQGKLVSDQSIKFPEIRLSSKEQVSDFINLRDHTVMVCKQEKEIIVQTNQSDGTVIKEEKIKPATKKITETTRSESQDNSSIRYWYDHCFYVYGYRTVKDNTTKISHDVFYIVKIRVD